MDVKLKAKPNASKRTKNRIAENGPEFIVRNRKRAECMDMVDSVLLQAWGTEWRGWLPVSELDIDHQRGRDWWNLTD